MDHTAPREPASGLREPSLGNILDLNLRPPPPEWIRSRSRGLDASQLTPSHLMVTLDAMLNPSPA